MKIYRGFEKLKNFKGECAHPVDHVLFFASTEEHRQKMIALYDRVMDGLSEDERKTVLEPLLDMWADERISNREYSDGE
jgi:hypothetical protein